MKTNRQSNLPFENRTEGGKGYGARWVAGGARGLKGVDREGVLEASK